MAKHQIFLAAASVLLLWVAATSCSDPIKYRIPSPIDLKEAEQFNYKITSEQTTKVGDKIISQYDVVELYSLKTGLTYATYTLRGEEYPAFRKLQYDFSDTNYIIDRKSGCSKTHHAEKFPFRAYAYAFSNKLSGQIFGTMALIMNALYTKVNSSSVGENSPEVDYNLWSMRSYMATIDFYYAKPKNWPASDEDRINVIARSGSNLRKLVVSKENHHDHNSSEVIHLVKQEISIKSFVTVQDNSAVKEISQWKTFCHYNCEDDVLMPNLNAQLSLYHGIVNIQYKFERFNGMKINNEGVYDERYHRPRYNSEFVIETLDLHRMAQIVEYKTTEVNPKDPFNVRADKFYKFFTRDPVSGKQPRDEHHMIGYYHLVRDPQPSSCQKGEIFGPQDMLLANKKYKFHFMDDKTAETREIGGHIIGLTAILLNIGKKHNSFLTHTSNKDSKGKLTHQWVYKDWQQMQVFVFQFAAPATKMSYLKRVLVYKDEGIRTYDPKDLLYSYKINDIEHGAPASRFQLDPLCKNAVQVGDDLDDDFDSDELDSDDDVDDDDDDDLENPDADVQDTSFFSFYEYFDTNAASSYHIDTTMSFGGQAKFIKLVESFDFDKSIAKLEVHTKQDERFLPMEHYYINYNSEVVMLDKEREHSCSVLDQLPTWMRLLSARSTYHTMTKVPQEDGSHKVEFVEAESERLRFYGPGALWRHASDNQASVSVDECSPNNVFKRDNREYYECRFKFIDDGNSQLPILFKFVVDKTKIDEYKRAKRWVHMIEMVKLESIIVGDSSAVEAGVFSKFENLNVQIDDLQRAYKTEWSLPDECQRVLNDMAMQADMSYVVDGHNLAYAMPKLDSYIAPDADFAARYTITVHQQVEEPGAGGEPIEILESLDRTNQRASIQIGDNPDKQRFIFADGKTKKLYHYTKETNKCELVNSLQELPEFGSMKGKPMEFDFAKFDSVSRLVSLMDSLEGKKAHLMVQTEHDKFGDEHKRLMYVFDSNEAADAWVQVTFETTSNKKRSLVPDKDDEDNKKSTMLKWDHVKLTSIWVSERLADEFSSRNLIVDVADIIPALLEPMMDLPEACKTPDGDDPNDQVEFPNLIDMVKASRMTKPVFHIKSELTSTEPTIEGHKMLLMDEWYSNDERKYRLKTSRHNLDVLIYGASNEVFDVSKKYLCGSQLPKMFGSDQSDPSRTKRVKDFFFDREALLEGPLSYVYYSPLALWLLASRKDSETKRIKVGSLEQDFDDDSLDYETDIWQVKAKDGKRKWSYQMIFSRHKEVSDLVRLDSIRILEGDNNRQVEIDVLHYEILMIKQCENKFFVPIGYGCKRCDAETSQNSRTYDNLVYHESNYILNELAFDAILEIYPQQANFDSDEDMDDETDHESEDEDEDDDDMSEFDDDMDPTSFTHSVLGPVSGKYCEFSNAVFNGSILHELERRPGQPDTDSWKTFVDRNSGIVHLIEMQSGLCQVQHRREVSSETDWVLNFRSDYQQVETIELTNELQTLILMDTDRELFHPLRSDAWFVYERRTDKPVRLNNNLVGPASIVRTYKDEKTTTNWTKKGQYRLHNSIQTKVLIFNDDMSKLRAKLSFNVEVIQSDDPWGYFFKLSNVAECYNRANPNMARSTRSFRITYEDDKFVSLQSLRSQLKPAFISMLISPNKASLLPSQLGGSPTMIEHPRANTKQVEFELKLMDPPSAVDYYEFKRRSSFTDDFVAKSMLRILPTLVQCSRWCDHIGCIGMTFCQQTYECRVVSRSMMADKSLAELYTRLSKTNPASCSYYYVSASVKIPITVEKFANQMTKLANDHTVTMDSKFALSYGTYNIRPVKFVELDKEFESKSSDGWAIGDLVDSNEYVDSQALPDENDLILRLVRDQSKLVIGDDALAAKLKLKHDIVKADMLADCVQSCKREHPHDCFALSFDRKSLTCTRLFGKADPKTVLAAFVAPDDSSSVMLRDYLVGYSVFQDTVRPKNYTKMLDGYSPLECATMCGQANSDEGDHAETPEAPDCLSFDVCSSDETGHVCYLRSDHLFMDTFDRWSLRDFDSTQDHELDITCNHYSKSILSDYHKLEGSQLKQESTYRGDEIEAANEDRCAMDCSQYDDCKGFQFCFDPSQVSPQSCFLVRSGESGPLKLSEVLEPSKFCSFYTKKHSRETPGLEPSSDNGWHLPELPAQHGRWVAIVVLLLVALSIGTAVQLLAIKYFGRSVIFAF